MIIPYDITSTDLDLKKNNISNVLYINNLTVFNANKQSLLELKEAAYHLNSIKNEVIENVDWTTLLKKQMQHTVERAKKYIPEN